jgi:hypothetical protein
MYDDDGRQVMAKAHMAFGQVSSKNNKNKMVDI